MSRRSSLDPKKRDLSVTPEPRGTARERASGGRFVVEMHDARQLHYDLRLELDGVMKSWAVMRGPSLDPADRRLAVRTEDHSLSDFENARPRGEHGGAAVMLWDRGRWQPRGDPREDLDKGVLKFDLEGERLKGGFALVRLGKKARESRENWILIKERDAHAERDGRVSDHWMNSIITGRAMDAIGEPADGRRAVKRRGRRVTRRAKSRLLADDEEDPSPRADRR